jgi:SsrA-binding protein
MPVETSNIARMAAGKPPKPNSNTTRIVHKKARFEYDILEKVEAGIVLKGTEVKALRAGDASLNEAYARVDSGQATLHNFQIQPYKQANQFNHDPKRVKRLLLHRREIKKLASKVQIRGLTLIPLVVYFNSDGRAKVELALAKGKTHGDKRQTERKKQDVKDMARIRRGGL